MTAYLLDTNAFAMAITGDVRLPRAALERMTEASRLAIPAISFFEIGQKVRLGKWPQMADHVETLEAQASADGYDILPLSAPTALKASLLDWDHRDPFDRMIAATADREGLALISSDKAFDHLHLRRYWDD